jgi:nitroreductase/NAD-dependent dihydropyrimidine dehydrogenase PreA subunit
VALFAVDQNKCIRDGLCVAECPRFLIEMADEDSLPTPIKEAEDLCINCGHCVAVCPTAALSLRDMAPEDCPNVDEAGLPSAAQVEIFLRARRSIRTYEKRLVPPETLEKLIDIARYGPTGGNSQPVEWLVIYDPVDVQKLAGLVEEWMLQSPAGSAYSGSLPRAKARGIDLICRGAPHVVIAHTPPGRETDGVIALEYLELAAFAMGLGPCWGGFINGAAHNWPPAQEFLALPEGRVCCGAMLLGYPVYSFRRLPSRNPARVIWRGVEANATRPSLATAS